MRRFALALAVLLLWPSGVLAQSDWAFSTLNLPHGTATPVSCKTGDVYGQTVPTAGLYFCNPDNTWTFSGGGGGGISNLNGLTDAAQTFAKVDDANVTLAISSVSPTHTFTMGWTGTLGLARGGTNADLSVGPCASCFVKTNPGGTALVAVSPPIIATQGGTGITSVAQSGSVLFWDTTTTLAASATLTNHAMVVGGGAGGAPKTLAALTDGQLYIGSTGLDPVAASLTAGSNITITPGAGSITIAATAAGTVTHSLGPLTLNAFVLGNGAADVKAQAITGLVVGAGASAPSGFAGSTCAGGQFASSISSVGSLSCAVPVSAAGGANTQVQFNNVGVLAGDSNMTWDNTNKRLTVGAGDQFHVINLVTKTPDRLMVLEGTAGSPQTNTNPVTALFQTQATATPAWSSLTTYNTGDLVFFDPGSGPTIWIALNTNTNKQPNVNPANWSTACTNAIDPNCGSAFQVLVKKTAASVMQATAIYGAVINQSTAVGGTSGGDSAAFYADMVTSNQAAGGTAYFGQAKRTSGSTWSGGFGIGAFEAHVTNDTTTDCTYAANDTTCAALSAIYDDAAHGKKGGSAVFVKGSGAKWQTGLHCASSGVSDFCVVDFGSSTGTYQDQGTHTRGFDLANATYSDAAITLSSTSTTNGKIRWGSGLFIEGNTPSIDPGVDLTGTVGTAAHRFNEIRAGSIFATGYTAGGSVGLTVTKTVRAAGGGANCTLIFTGGILTGGTC